MSMKPFSSCWSKVEVKVDVYFPTCNPSEGQMYTDAVQSIAL